MVKEVLKTNDGSKDNAEAVKPIADIDVLIQRVRPGEKQCNSFKNELKSFDSDDKLMDKLKKGQFVDFPADSGRQNRSFIAYAGLDPLAMKKGTYGDRPDLRPGKGDGRLAEAPPWEGTVKEVFGKAAMAIVRNHVEIGDLNLQKIMAEKGLPKDAPVTLLNFDAHSDIYSGRGAVDGKENIGNWVNVMLQKNPNITDFYWVMPNDFKDKPEYSHYYYSGKNHDRILADSTPDRTVYINNKTGDFSWDVKPDDFSESDYRTVGIHKRALQDMPDLSAKNIVSSLDVDALANRGYDTALGAKTDWRGDPGIQDFLNKYKELGIRPFLSVISMSPEYVKSEALPRLEQLAWTMVKDGDTGKDLLATPYRNYINPGYASPDGHHHGILTMRYEHPVYQLLSALHRIDQETKGPDGALSLKRGPENQELEQAIAATADLYKTTPDKAFGLLKGYANKWKFNDAQSKDVLNFGWVEELLRHTCQQGAPKPGKAG